MVITILLFSESFRYIYQDSGKKTESDVSFTLVLKSYDSAHLMNKDGSIVKYVRYAGLVVCFWQYMAVLKVISHAYK